MDNWINSTRLRHELTEVLAGLQDLEEPLTIVQRAHPIGILWSYERFERLTEKLEGAENLLTVYGRADEPAVEFKEAVRDLEGEPRPATA
jgi:prevent-host-death family protein